VHIVGFQVINICSKHALIVKRLIILLLSLQSNSAWYLQDVIWILLSSPPMGMFEEGQIQEAAKSNEGDMYLNNDANQ
jgi:hypothetical protein